MADWVTLLNQGSWRMSRLRLCTMIGRWPSVVVKDLECGSRGLLPILTLYFRCLIRDEESLIGELKFDMSDWECEKKKTAKNNGGLWYCWQWRLPPIGKRRNPPNFIVNSQNSSAFCWAHLQNAGTDTTLSALGPLTFCWIFMVTITKCIAHNFINVHALFT